MARKPKAEQSLPEPKAPVPAARTRRAAAPEPRQRTGEPDLDDLVDMVDGSDPDDDDSGGPIRQSRRMPDRQQAELVAAVHAKLTGAPMFPFPPELKDEHKPYWVETVNSKPHDYFNNGDLHLLKLYCRVAADIDRLDREISDEGSVVLNNRNNPIVNPRVLVRSIAETRLLSLSTKLRLQPASRYDSENDKNQGLKKKKANAASRTLDEDDDDLLAGGGGGISASRGALN